MVLETYRKFRDLALEAEALSRRSSQSLFFEEPRPLRIQGRNSPSSTQTTNRFFAGLKLDERYYEQEEVTSTTSSRSAMLRTPSGTAPVGVMGGAGLIGASGGIMVMTTNGNDGDPDSAEDIRARRRRRVLNRK